MAKIRLGKQVISPGLSIGYCLGPITWSVFGKGYSKFIFVEPGSVVISENFIVAGRTSSPLLRPISRLPGLNPILFCPMSLKWSDLFFLWSTVRCCWALFKLSWIKKCAREAWLSCVQSLINCTNCLCSRQTRFSPVQHKHPAIHHLDFWYKLHESTPDTGLFLHVTTLFPIL